MFEKLATSSLISKALFLGLIGMAGVFTVLLIFFFMSKLLIKIFPFKEIDDDEQS